MSRVLIAIALCICIVAIKAIHFDNVPEGYRVKDVDTYDCYWKCDNEGSHWTQFLECLPDEIAVGTCGVENRASCNNNAECGDANGYAALQCCKATVILEAISQ